MTGWRIFRWSLVAYGPLVLAVVMMGVLVAVNPAKQIEKAKQQQQLLEQQQVELTQ